MYEPKDLKYESLPGLSDRQLREHHDVLYVGYCKKTDAIREQLEKTDRNASNATFAEYRELKLEEGFATNGVRLHEAYFDSLSPTPQPASELLASWIIEDFESMENWANDFAACAMAARGWAILTFDLHDGKLHNYTCDMHNQGGVWGAIPLMVMDVYEHAYFLDFATARKGYLDTMMPLLNWDQANETLTRYRLNEHRK